MRENGRGERHKASHLTPCPFPRVKLVYTTLHGLTPYNIMEKCGKGTKGGIQGRGAVEARVQVQVYWRLYLAIKDFFVNTVCIHDSSAEPGSVMQEAIYQE